MQRLFSSLAAMGLIALATPAEAGFLGTQMSATYEYPALGTPYPDASFAPSSFTVTDDPGFETIGDVEGVTSLPVQFTDSTLTITLNTTLTNPTWNNTAFNGIVFESVGPLGILGATVNAGATTLVGFDDSRVGFSVDRVTINWAGLTYHDGDQVVVEFTFAPAVPEPTSLVTLGLGCVGLLAVRLRRRRSS